LLTGIFCSEDQNEISRLAESYQPADIINKRGSFEIIACDYVGVKMKGPLFYPGKRPAADPFEEGQPIPLP